MALHDGCLGLRSSEHGAAQTACNGLQHKHHDQIFLISCGGTFEDLLRAEASIATLPTCGLHMPQLQQDSTNQCSAHDPSLEKMPGGLTIHMLIRTL